MAEQHPLSETLLDLLVYAPLGAAVVASEELPRLAGEDASASKDSSAAQS